MTQKMITPPIDKLLGYDIDGRPGNVVLVFQDAKGVEYGVQLTPTGLDKAIVCAMQALVEMRKRSQKSQKDNVPAFAEYSLTGCQHFLEESGQLSIALQFDGLLNIAFPITKAEGDLVIRECQAALDYMAKTGTKGPERQ